MLSKLLKSENKIVPRWLPRGTPHLIRDIKKNRSKIKTNKKYTAITFVGFCFNFFIKNMKRETFSNVNSRGNFEKSFNKRTSVFTNILDGLSDFFFFFSKILHLRELLFVSHLRSTHIHKYLTLTEYSKFPKRKIGKSMVSCER